MQVPFDSMHQIDLGITKETLRVTFFQGKEKQTMLYQKQLQEMLSDIKVPSEHDRTSKAISLGETKAKEYKFIGLFTNISIARVIFNREETNEVEIQQLFLITTFVYRALMLEDEQYERVERKLDSENVDGCRSVQELLYRWLPLWQELYGINEMHYNFHIFCHAAESRRHTGPLYKTSCEPFEALYGKCKMLYEKGTINVPKQIIKNFLLGANARHRCASTPFRLTFKTNETMRSNDTLCWLGGDRFYRVTALAGDGTATAYKLQTRPFSTEDVNLPLPWRMVGVAYEGRENQTQREETIELREALGKGVRLPGNIVAAYSSKWIVK